MDVGRSALEGCLCIRACPLLLGADDDVELRLRDIRCRDRGFYLRDLHIRTRIENGVLINNPSIRENDYRFADVAGGLDRDGHGIAPLDKLGGHDSHPWTGFYRDGRVAPPVKAPDAAFCDDGQRVPSDLSDVARRQCDCPAIGAEGDFLAIKTALIVCGRGRRWSRHDLECRRLVHADARLRRRNGKRGIDDLDGVCQSAKLGTRFGNTRELAIPLACYRESMADDQAFFPFHGSVGTLEGPLGR